MANPVLVTGGLGFLGRSLARDLEERGTRAALLDIVAGTEGSAQVIRADVRDAAAVREAFVSTGARIVIHAAAQLPLADPREIRTTTIDGTRIMLEAARRHGVERFVFISSTAVYPLGGKTDRREEAPLQGIGPYGEAKIVAERMCADFRDGNMSVTILRPKSFIGPGRMGVFQLLFDWVREGRRIPMIGGGANRYQLLDVADLNAAIRTVINGPPKAASDIFNVGAVEFGNVVGDLLALCTAAGTGARPIGTPRRATAALLNVLHRAHLAPIYPWVYQTAAEDSSVPVARLQSLGWHPRYSNAQSLIRSYQAHRDRVASGRPAGPVTGHLAPWKAGALDVLKHLF